MKFLLDTNVVSELTRQRPNPNVVRWFRSVPSTDLFLSVVRDAGIGPDDDPAALARVVRMCGGLPLALRIVAALRVRNSMGRGLELLNEPKSVHHFHDTFAGNKPIESS